MERRIYRARQSGNNHSESPEIPAIPAGRDAEQTAVQEPNGVVGKVVAGRRFGRLVVLGFSHSDGRLRWWVCRCDCGTTLAVKGASLTSPSRKGRKSSCGCLQREVAKTYLTTHGASHRPEWHAWRAMLDRCENPSNRGYRRYGGRGIAVCQEWHGDDGYHAFYAEVGPRPSSEHSIDRIDNNKGYEPGNVRWTTRDVQAANTRSVILVEHNGDTRSLRAWSIHFGIPHQTLTGRYHRGVRGDALFRPTGFRPRRPRRPSSPAAPAGQIGGGA
jgi:hypothetical protein